MHTRSIPTLLFAAILGGSVMSGGCSTTGSSDTARTGTEQLLISNSIDQALDKVDFRAFRNQRVFLDTQYVECVDKNYLISSVRHRMLTTGATLAGSADDADLVVELRSGAIGTDRVETFLGMPEIALPGPVPVSLPEIRLLSRESQFGTAKLGLVAYDAKTKQALGTGGMTAARADNNNWFLLGMGPWQNGSVKGEVNNAVRAEPRRSSLPSNVAFARPIPSFDPAGTTDLVPVSNRREITE